MAKKVFPGLTKGIEMEEDGTLSLLIPVNYLDLAELIAEPVVPPARTLRLFVEEVKGFPFYSFKDSTGMVRKIVRDSVFVGKNVTGATIPMARAVYASGSADGVPTIAKARANSVATMPAIGVTIESVADGAYGRVMQVGLFEDVDTSSFSAGDVLYVSAAVAGILVATAPGYPNITQEIGTILVKDAAVGAVQVVARSMFRQAWSENPGAGEPALVLDQGDEDDVFVNFVGTSAADQTKSISTAQGDGALSGPKSVNLQPGWEFEGMVRVEINGVMKWMPYYIEVE